MTTTVYLSGPISGQTLAGAKGWRDWVKTKLAPGIKAVDPFRGKEAALAERMGDKVFGSIGEYEDLLNCSRRAIVTRDRHDAMTSDALLVNLLGAGEKVSIGTVTEMAWADAKRIPIVLVTDGTVPWSGHPFVRLLAGWVVKDVPTGVDVINSLLSAKAAGGCENCR